MDRRAHPRLPSTHLRVTRVGIQNRKAASLVDLSSGGALLELPFQVRPDSRVAVQLDTPVDRVEVPFQLLRCYVVDLKGGVTYRAAGAFDRLLNVEELARQASGAVQRLIESLERLHCAAEDSAEWSESDAAFDRLTSEVIGGLRRGEALHLIALRIRAKLTQRYPALLILSSPAGSSHGSTSVSCFGLTLVSRYTLSAHDRRYLKAHAQVISMLEDTRRELQYDDAASCAPPNVYVLRPGSRTRRRRPAN